MINVGTYLQGSSSRRSFCSGTNVYHAHRRPCLAKMTWLKLGSNYVAPPQVHQPCYAGSLPVAFRIRDHVVECWWCLSPRCVAHGDTFLPCGESQDLPAVFEVAFVHIKRRVLWRTRCAVGLAADHSTKRNAPMMRLV